MTSKLRKDITGITDPFAFARRLKTPIWVYDTDNYRVAYANAAACKLWDAKDEAELRRRDLSIDMTKIVSNRLRRYQSDFKEKNAEFLETWTIHPNGKPVTLDLIYSGYEMPDGRMAMLIEAAGDKNLTTENLRSTEALLRTDVIIAMFSESGKPLYKNPAAWNMLPGTDITLDQFFSNRNDYEDCRRSWQQDGDSQRITQLKTVSGERWLDVRIKRCPDAFDGKASLLVTAIDVHELRAVKAQSILYQEQLEATFETSLDGIVMVDNQGKILGVNKSTQQIFGYKQEALLHKIFVDMLVPERLREGMAKQFTIVQEKMREELLKRRFELTACRANGEEFCAEISISQSKSSAGEDIYIVYIRDVSKAKAAKNALIGAMHAAEAGSQAKSEFLANISHEIRTPMNGVLGMLEVLGTTALTPEQIRYTDIIQQSGDNLMAIINDMLDFTKLEARALPLDLVPCHLENVIQDVVETLRPRAEEKDLSVTVEYSPDLPQRFITDHHRIHQIISNLLGNAIKFTPAGEVVVSVSGTLGDESADIIIAVKDTGIGIAKNKQEMIFDKFTQAEGSLSREYGGMGLGLSISKHLAEVLGGTLSVSSEEGQGSTFSLHLSMVLPADKKPAASTPPLKAAHQNKNKKTHLNILIAEDDETSRTALAAMLSHKNINLSYCKTGLCVMKACEARKHDLIFISTALPVMDGLKASEKIRISEKNLGRKYTPIIALTPKPAPQDLAKFLQAGINDFVTRPLQKTSVLRAMSKGLMPAPSAAQARRA